MKKKKKKKNLKQKRKIISIAKVIIASIIVITIVAIQLPRALEIEEKEKQIKFDQIVKLLELVTEDYIEENKTTLNVNSKKIIIPFEEMNEKIKQIKGPNNKLCSGGVEITYINEKYVYDIALVCEDYASDFILSKKNNTPRVTNNMYPVMWNGKKWEVISDVDSSWFRYNGDINNTSDKLDGIGEFTSDIWGNAQISEEELKPGDLIKEENLNLYVWIPRYSYKINYADKKCNWPTKIKDCDRSEGNIKIKYSHGTIDELDNDYIIHPAFNFNDKKLTGIWVAKFEISNPEKYISKPNEAAITNMSIGSVYTESIKIKDIYKLKDINTHFMKSSEWSAVIYLASAIRDGENIWMNNQGIYDENSETIYSNSVTGCGGNTRDEATAAYTNQEECQNTYETNQGIKTSTTGNISGVYDLYGGLWENVATYLEYNDLWHSRYLNEEYGREFYASEEKYKEVLISDPQGRPSSAFVSHLADGVNNYLYNNETLGLALHEISEEGQYSTSWEGGNSYYPSKYLPYLKRGGDFQTGKSGGIFSYTRHSGAIDPSTTWRASIVFED